MMEGIRFTIDDVVSGNRELAKNMFRIFGEKQGVVDLELEPKPLEDELLVEELIAFNEYVHKMNLIGHTTDAPFLIDEAYSKVMSYL